MLFPKIDFSLCVQNDKPIRPVDLNDLISSNYIPEERGDAYTVLRYAEKTVHWIGICKVN